MNKIQERKYYTLEAKRISALASENKWNEIFSKIDSEELSVNFYHGYLLKLAIIKNNLDAVKGLFERGIEIRIEAENFKSNESSLNYLMLAIARNKGNIVDFLLPHYFKWGTKEENDDRFIYWQKDHPYSTDKIFKYLDLAVVNGNHNALNYILNFSDNIFGQKELEKLFFSAIKANKVKEKSLNLLNDFQVPTISEDQYSYILSKSYNYINTIAIKWLLKKSPDIIKGSDDELKNKIGYYGIIPMLNFLEDNNKIKDLKKETILYLSIKSKDLDRFKKVWNKVDKYDKNILATNLFLESINNQSNLIFNKAFYEHTPYLLPYLSEDTINNMRNKSDINPRLKSILNKYILEQMCDKEDNLKIKRIKI